MTHTLLNISHAQYLISLTHWPIPSFVSSFPTSFDVPSPIQQVFVHVFEMHQRSDPSFLLNLPKSGWFFYRHVQDTRKSSLLAWHDMDNLRHGPIHSGHYGNLCAGPKLKITAGQGTRSWRLTVRFAVLNGLTVSLLADFVSVILWLWANRLERIIEAMRTYEGKGGLQIHAQSVMLCLGERLQCHSQVCPTHSHTPLIDPLFVRKHVSSHRGQPTWVQFDLRAQYPIRRPR